MRFTKGLLAFLISGLSFSTLALADTSKDGFIEGSQAKILSRNVYFNRDYRKESANGAGTNAFKDYEDRKGYREEWAQGFLGTFDSGFTQGTVGFGIDAYAMLGLKLDSGGGRTGTGLLPIGSDGKPADNYSEAGGAVKMRISKTVVKYGNMFVETPVFDTGDSRLLPETATGVLVQSNEIENLTLIGGHFTALNDQVETRRDSVFESGHTLESANFFGGSYIFNSNWVASLYASDVKNFWKKKYANVHYVYPVNDMSSLDVDFNIYKTKDEGKAYAGEIDSTLWSLGGSYTYGAHKVALIRQVSSGKGPGAPYSVDGGDTIYVGNSVQYSDFNHEDEKSWQVRYDLNMATYGVPGLSFMTRYVTSDNIRLGDGNSGKAWERNIEVKYIVQAGPAKDLSVRLRQANYRSAGLGENIDEVRLITEYPLNIF